MRSDETDGHELLIDWDRYQGLALEWERREGEFQRDWERRYPDGAAWEQVTDYHRYGYASRKIYGEVTCVNVIERVRVGIERGDWETRDPWPLIEAALSAGWNAASDGREEATARP